MNKKVLLALAAGIVMLAACKKDNVGTGFSKKETVTATLPKTSTPTKTTLSGLQVVWGDDDAISVFAQDGSNITNNEGTISGGQGTTQATFDVVVEGTQKLAALYPYSLTSAYDGEKMSINMKDTYAYVENGIGGAPMASLIKSSAQSAPITFKNAGALMGLTVNNIPAGYNKAILTSKGDEVIAGPCEITFDAEGNPTMVATASATGKEITITFDAASELTNKTFYFPIPVDDYSSLQLSISDGSNVKVLKTKALVAERSIRYKSTLTLDAVTGVIPTEVEGTAAANEALADGKTSLSVTVAEDETTPTITMPQGDVPTTLSFEPIPTGKVVTIQEGTEGNVTENLTIAASSEPTSSNSFEIIMPNSTVTLDANGEEAVYDEVTAHTAANTLIVETGVTIKTLKIKGGNVKVEEGGEIENILFTEDNQDNVTYVTYEGVEAKKVAYVVNLDGLKAALADNTTTEIILMNDITTGETVKILNNVVINGNNKKLTYSGSDRAIDMPSVTENATELNVTIKDLTVDFSSGYSQRGINYNANGELVLEKVKINGDSKVTYALNFPAKSNGAEVTVKDCELTGLIALNIWGEDMTINVTDSELTSVDKNTVENYAAVSLSHNGIEGANGTIVNIEGGSIVANDENSQPAIAVRNSTTTGEVNIGQKTQVTGSVKIQVAAVIYEGYNEFYSCSSLKEAVDKAIETNGKVRLVRDIALEEIITIKAGAVLTIDLNGKTITGTDKTEKNFSIIDNRGTLTLINSDAEKEGKITLTATVNSGWGRYSAVLANNPGGNLTVESGVVIEHLGGTDMAYGIDNLTNGKGTSAVTKIDGATIKSSYIGIRQFLNGTEATNDLHVKSGTIEGVKRSVWMQSPNTNANTGKLVVESAAKLKGNAQLSVTQGSTEVPVEISVAKTALVDGAEFTQSNLPDGYEIVLNNGNYVIKKVVVYRVSTLADLKTALTSAGSAAAGYSTIYIESDINMTGQSWTPISIDGYNGADIVTIEGGEHTITGLTAGLFKGGFAGGSGIVIKDLTISGATITANDTQGYGAFVGCADSMEEITLINCHLEKSTIITPNDGADESRIGGLIGWTAGYNNVNDGPVDSYITVKDCSVTGCTLKGAGSIGGIVGHAGANAATFTVIESCTLSDNTFTSTDDGGWRVGVVVGTANNGQCVIKDITESGNTLSQTGKEAPAGNKRNYYGRFVPSGTGTLTIDGVEITE